jgi:hypothetical protein
MGRATLVLTILGTLYCASIARASEIVALTTNTAGGAYAIDRDGNMYGLALGASTWNLRENVLDNSGLSGSAHHVAGMVLPGGSITSALVLLEDGTTLISLGDYAWRVSENVWASAGIENTGDVFVLLGTNILCGGGSVYAVTAQGETFSRLGSDPWQYTGNILGSPTATRRSSWGGLKVTYR